MIRPLACFFGDASEHMSGAAKPGVDTEEHVVEKLSCSALISRTARCTAKS